VLNKDSKEPDSTGGIEPTANPDIIDLPRRVIGTPQVVAGYIFILALLALSGTFMVVPNVTVLHDRLYWFKEAYEAEATTEAERIECREEIEREYMQPLRFYYTSMACFAFTGLSLALGAISLAFFLAFGRKYSLVNTALLPIGMSAGCYFILLAQEADKLWRNTLLFVLFFATMAIIIRRIVEWVSPIRDESAERRDRLHKSNIARASAATVFFISFLRGLSWLVFIFIITGDPQGGWTEGIWKRFKEWLVDASFPYTGREFLIFSILFVPMILGGFVTVLFLLRRGRILTFVFLLALMAFEVVAITFFFLLEFSMGPPLSSPVLGIVPGILLLYYPYVILAIMLRQPLGLDLFKPSPAVR